MAHSAWRARRLSMLRTLKSPLQRQALRLVEEVESIKNEIILEGGGVIRMGDTLCHGGTFASNCGSVAVRA